MGRLLRNSDSHLVAQGYCMGYITGVSQIGTLAYRIGYSSAQKRQPQTNRDICIPPNVSLVERIKAVIAYLYSHPEKLEKHQTVLTYQALRETYPCAKPE
ncbi:MAG: hypothetical protein GWN58_04440 [Anaerolineae bacterium]|nr:hypothetical protein [Anaerolineae bacterium]